MTELEKIAYAKSFIDKLANGINPIDDSVIPDGDAVNNVRLSRCFFYVSDILRQVIDNGGITPAPEVKEVKPKKRPYSLSPEETARFEYSDTPITISEIHNRIIAIGPQEGVKKFPRKNLTQWLMSIGLLKEIEDISGKKAKRPTPEGEMMGISLEDREGMYGPYSVVLYNAEAQHFILDNIDCAICFNSDELKDIARPVLTQPADVKTDEYDNINSQKDQIGEGQAPVYKATVDNRRPERTCRSCRFARSGDCFPQKDICTDFEPAFEVPKSERDAWPEFGDATAFRLKNAER